MGVAHIVSQLQMFGGMPEDRVQTTFNIAFLNEAAFVADVLEIAVGVTNFWNTVPAGGTNFVAHYVSEVVQRTAGGASILGYYTDDFSGATPLGSPLMTASFTLGNAGAGGQFPEEVAACISYNADLDDVPITEPNPTPPPAIIRPQQRRRGRMFIGPLASLSGTDGAQSIRPSSTFMTDLGLAFSEMCEYINANTDGTVSVWSKADGAMYPVVGGYVDNAWDTQRRRGLDATTRVAFTVA